MSIEKNILVAINASLRAGERILTVRNQSVHTEYKKDHSPVTEADYASQSIIMDHLQPVMMPVISEESTTVSYNIRKKYTRYWLVDPLDGTKDFIHGSDGFTVNIAFIQAQYPLAGVVYAPARKELYFSLPEKGAFKLTLHNVHEFSSVDDLLQNSNILNADINTEIIRIVASKSHLNDKTKAYIESVKNIASKTDIVNIGSSLKFCLIAEGKADIYPRFGTTMEWDTAAGQAVAEAAGAVVVDADEEKRLIYNKKDLKNPEFIVFRVPALRGEYYK